MRDNDVIFFISNKRIGVVRPDGTDKHYPEFPAPNQAGRQPGQVLNDGRHAVLWSQEPPRNPRAGFYDKDGRGQAGTHLWLYDLEGGVTRELHLPEQHGVVGELPGVRRLPVGGNLEGKTYLFTCDMDGGSREKFFAGPGFAYGTTLSPDGLRAAFHITGAPDRPGYEIYVIELDSRERVRIAGDPEYLHFGPVWSPDSQWVLYQRCAHRQDPAHERSDLCINRADGSEHRLLTTGRRHWFATSYGPADNPGNGSNLPAWSPDGKWITFTRCLPGSQTAWLWNPNRPDTDHFNRGYRPDLARGGTETSLIDPASGRIAAISRDKPPTWNFRCAWSPDASRLAFARADVGRVPEPWVMDADGGNRRFLTRGLDRRGADHGRWVRLAIQPGWNHE